ncbi:MAG: F0F1 ATP synthase subunit epsilon [Rhodobacterales bacterium]|nr:F0F1 ATP synthase subunit epsilon [Rhodobacterales bacterium]
MADTMQFDLVSPERSVASLAISEVQIPGADGDMTAMQGHVPVITTLRAGVLRVNGPEGSQDYVVTGGFAEINADSISVLAEKAMLVSDAKADELDALVATATKAAADATGEIKDAADKQLADLEALRVEIGI